MKKVARASFAAFWMVACGPILGLEPPPDMDDAGVGDASHAAVGDGPFDADAAADANANADGGGDAGIAADVDAGGAADVDAQGVGIEDATSRDAQDASPLDDADATDGPPDALIGPDAADATADAAGNCFRFDVTPRPFMSAIAAAPDGSVWAIEKPTLSNPAQAQPIHHFSNGVWVAQGGSAVDIAVAPDTGEPWIVDAAGAVAKLGGGSWQTVSTSPTMSRIAVAAGGAMWAVGTEPWQAGSPDLALYSWANGAWKRETGGLVQISISPDGSHLWGVNTGSILFKRESVGGWMPMQRRASWTAASSRANGAEVWIIGDQPWAISSPDLGIFRSLEGSNWDQQYGGARRISISSDGKPWALNYAGEVFAGSPGAACLGVEGSN